MEELNEFERTYLNRVASHYPMLKSHLPYLRIKDRETTGVGMFINICYHPDDIELMPVETGSSGTINSNETINVDNLEYGLAEQVDIQDGRVNFIELVTYGEAWDGLIES